MLLSHGYQTSSKASLIQTSVLPSHLMPGKHCKTPSPPRAQGVGIQCPFITRHLSRAGAVQSSLINGVAIVCCSHLGFALQPCLQLRPDNELSSSISTSSMALLSSLQEYSSSPSKTSEPQNSEPKPANKHCFTSRFPAFRNNIKCPWKTLNRVFQGPDPGAALCIPWVEYSCYQAPGAAGSCGWKDPHCQQLLLAMR